MKCEYCGQECSDGLTFCSKCGKVFKKSGEKTKESSRSLVGIVLILVILIIIAVGYSLIKNIDSKNRELSNTITYDNDINTEDAKQKEDLESKENANEENPQNDNTIYSVVESPQYDTLTVKKYNLSISYPSHFVKENNENEYSLLSLKDPNGAAMVEFYGTDSIKGISSKELADVLTENIESENSKLLDEFFEDNSFYKKYRVDNAVYIIYGITTDTGVYFFNFAYAEFEDHVYSDYFNYIRDNFIVIDEENI